MTSTASHPETPQPPLPPSTAATDASNTTTTTADLTAFPFPAIYAFPPFFTLQPNPTTLSSQLNSWSTLIQSYCRHNRLFALTLVDALPTPLFSNAQISRKLSLKDARMVISWMASAEGGNRAEWIGSGKTAKVKTGAGTAAADGGEGEAKAWIYWRRPEEWAACLEEWIERTGQRGSVVTLYEIGESDATRREEFHGMDGELLMKSLQVCVKRGKAQIFGGEGSEGVKFF